MHCVCVRRPGIHRILVDTCAWVVGAALLILSGCVTRPGPSRVGALPRVPPPSLHAGEIRGIWLADPRGADWGRIAHDLASAHFNSLFVKFSTGGAAYYPSDVLPFQGIRRDELSRCLVAMYGYGIAVHIWHVSLQMKDAPAAEIRRAITEDRVQRDRYGNVLYPSYRGVPILCPSSPVNREREIRAVIELARLGVQGIQLDHIRFADGDSCYCSNCRVGFEKMCGRRVSWPRSVTSGNELRSQFLVYRQNTITTLVSDIRRQLIANGSSAILSAAVFPDLQNARMERGQDWKTWADRSYLDLLCPMNYATSTSLFDRRLRAELEAVGGRIPVVAGIGAYQMNSAASLLDQIAATRRLRAKGFVIFNYDDRFARFFLPSLR